MANVSQKNGVFHVRFRYEGKQYKKSLKTRMESEAQHAAAAVERTIHNLLTGVLTIPSRVDPGDFIVSGGTLKEPRQVVRKSVPSLDGLIQEYLSQQIAKAQSTVYTEGIHLGNLKKGLAEKVQRPCTQITRRDLEKYLQDRLRERAGVTVKKERTTIIQLFSWAHSAGYLEDSPAHDLLRIKQDSDRPPFRTVAEIEAILKRGGLTDEQQVSLWESLYLTVDEIGELLTTVRQNAKDDFAPLLHIIPAYTGMRRGEILRLCWSDINFEYEHLIARSRKQSRQQAETRRQIDMHPELTQELRAWRELRQRGQYVICQSDKTDPLDADTANRAFWQPMRKTRWCLDASKNWFKVGFHTYRHSFASNLAAAGVDQRIIDEWMGHQTEAMRKRYRHLYPKNRRSAIECFSLKPTSEN